MLQTFTIGRASITRITVISFSEVINNALKLQFIGSSQLSSDLSYANLVVLSDSVGTAACASGWTRYSGTGMCYKLSEYDMSWYKSEEYCWNQRAGAHLASIHSEAESRWLNGNGWCLITLLTIFSAQFRDKYGQMDAWIGLRRDVRHYFIHKLLYIFSVTMWLMCGLINHQQISCGGNPSIQDQSSLSSVV